MNILKILTPKRIVGNVGERAAAKYLRRHGYKILERNLVSDDNEVDIVARRKNVIVYVEVKTRNAEHASLYEPRPASSVDSKKQRSIIKVATHYHAYHGKGRRARFDIIEVILKSGKIAEIKHLEGAFNKNSAYTGRYENEIR